MTAISASASNAALSSILEAAPLLQVIDSNSELPGSRSRTKYSASRLLAIVYTGPRGDVLQSFAYEVDEVGNRLSKTFEDGGAERYSYDDLDRLTSVAYPSGRVVTYEYDEVGNRTRMVDDGAETTYEHNAFNQLVRLVDGTGRTELGYDANGDRIEKVGPDGTTRYSWDFENRLTLVELPGGQVEHAGYDANGIRTFLHDSSGRTDFLLDGPSVVAEYQGGEETAKYTQSTARIDEVWAQDLGAGRENLLQDALGSVYGIADDAGRLRTRRAYDAYGAITAAEGGLGSRFGFTGRELDEGSRLLYARARYLSHATGTFLSEDPVNQRTHLVQSSRSNGQPFSWASSPHGGVWASGGIETALARYAYARANPVRFADPSGENWNETQILHGGVAAAATLGLLYLFLALPNPAGPYLLDTMGLAVFVAAWSAAATFGAGVVWEIHYPLPGDRSEDLIADAVGAVAGAIIFLLIIGFLAPRSASLARILMLLAGGVVVVGTEVIDRCWKE